MKNIYQNRIIHVAVIFIATTFLFGCKSKYNSIIDTNPKRIVHIGESKVYLNGPYLKDKTSGNGNFIQQIFKIFTFEHYQSEKPILWGFRMGKYKNNIQEGKWIAESYWNQDHSFNDTPYIRREEHFKNGLQHGDYIIYNREGDVIYYTEFINGTGIEKDYHPNGQLYYKTSKKDGYFADTLKLFDEDGRLSEVLYFEKDSLVFSERKHYYSGYGQRRNFGYDESEKKMVYNYILEDCNCLAKVVCTDSVYSFLNAIPLDEIGFRQQSVYMIDPKPIQISEPKFDDELWRFFRFTSMKMWISKKDMPEEFGESIDRVYSFQWLWGITKKSSEFGYLISLISSAIDSTTTFSRPAVSWDLSKLPDNWLLVNDKNSFKNFIDAVPWYEKLYPSMRKHYRNKELQTFFQKGIDYTQSGFYSNYSYLQMSVPVFDKDYKFALISVNGTFYIFRRDTVNGWELYFSGKRQL